MVDAEIDNINRHERDVATAEYGRHSHGLNHGPHNLDRNYKLTSAGQEKKLIEILG